MNLARRNFTKTSLGLVAGILSQAVPLRALGNDFWSMPRWIWIQRRETNEEVKICYFADGKIQQGGYVQACRILRDVKANQAVQMDPVLLDILCGIQGWVRAYGANIPLIANSGYRTSHTNANTEGAVKNSMHLYGAAADIWMPGIPAESIAKLGVYLNGGGVGFYPSRNFVHVDRGRLRTWKG